MKASSAIFISKEGMATFWFFVAAAAVLGSGYYVQSQTVKAGLRPQFIIMANPDVRAMMPGVDPVRENEIMVEQTRLAMDSIFNKSANGLDAPDRCKSLLSSEAWDWVKTELVSKQDDAFRDGRMHQKVEVAQIDLHKMAGRDDDATMAAVEGQLIRTGVLDGKLFNEVWGVRANLVWVRNPSLRTSGRQPSICKAFTCRETPIASTIRRTTPESTETAPKADVPPTTTAVTPTEGTQN